MTHNKTLIWAIIIFLLPTLACSLTGGGEESASSQVSLGAEAGAETDADSQQEVVEDTETVVEESTSTPEATGPESAQFTGIYGLQDFASFRANIVLEFEGGRGDVEGENTDAHQEYILEVTRDPAARYQRTIIQNEGTVAADVENEQYLIDDVTYTNTFDRWIAQQGALGRSQFTTPVVFAPLPDTAICDSAPETVNGVSAIRCTFTVEDLSNSSLDAATSNGEVWLAEDGNYVVKYQLEATDVAAKGAFSGSALQYFDVYRTFYDLTDINGDITISLPAEAEGTDVIDISGAGGSSGLAAPAQAEIALDNESALSYFIYDMPIEEIADFHRQDLTAAGWQELPDDSYVEDYNMLLAFEGDEGILRVFAFEDIDGGIFVNITRPFEMPDLSGGAAGEADVAPESAGDDTGEASPATGGDSEVPMLDDASDVLSMAGVTSYYTQASIDDVMAFYRQEIPALGWEESTDMSFNDETTGLLMFNRGNEALMVTVNVDNGRTNVGVIISEQ